MDPRKTLSLVVAVVSLGTAIMIPAPAQAAQSIQAQGQEQFVRVLMPGSVTQRDGHTLIQGTMDERRIDSADPWLAGWATLRYDTIIDPTGAGVLRGTFQLVSDAGGQWVGTFSGMSNAEHFCGHGHAQGKMGFEGLELILTNEDGQATAYFVESD